MEEGNHEELMKLQGIYYHLTISADSEDRVLPGDTEMTGGKER